MLPCGWKQNSAGVKAHLRIYLEDTIVSPLKLGGVAGILDMDKEVSVSENSLI